MTAPDDPVRAVEEGLAALGTRYQDAFARAGDEPALRDAYAAVLGKKKGELTAVMALLRHVPAERRPEVGAKINVFKDAVEQSFAARLRALGSQKREAELRAAPYDLTLPATTELWRGHAHPVLQVQSEILDVFRDLGFTVVSGPEVETEENNFGKLAFPPDHPATDMQDTFWVDVHGTDGRPKDGRVLLRTHTSNTQSRELSRRKPPMAIISAGSVYRRDDDITHSPMFHQIEGFLVDEGVSLANLRGVLSAFAEALYGKGTAIRLRPSYFPFVEPGAEVDIACAFCKPDDGSRARCRVCKSTGWLEVLGCGMIHPQVLQNCGIDPERWSGYAFGLGVDRLAMIKFGIPSIKLLFDNDPRFLAQF